MTGWQEAAEWLRVNSPEWRLGHGESRLVPGMTIGAPTNVRCEVTLIQPDAPDGPWVLGEGASFLEAVRNAVGGIRG